MKKFLAYSCSLLGLFAFTAYSWNDSSNKKEENTAPASAVSPKATAITTAAKVLGSGTPEEKKARMNSLMRLSQALANAKSANPDQRQFAPSAPLQVSETESLIIEEPIAEEQPSYAEDSTASEETERVSESMDQDMPAAEPPQETTSQKKKGFWGF